MGNTPGVGLHCLLWKEEFTFTIGKSTGIWNYEHWKTLNCTLFPFLIVFFSCLQVDKRGGLLVIHFFWWLHQNKVNKKRLNLNTYSAITCQLPVQFKRVCDFKKGSSNKNKWIIFPKYRLNSTNIYIFVQSALLHYSQNNHRREFSAPKNSKIFKDKSFKHSLLLQRDH